MMAYTLLGVAPLQVVVVFVLPLTFVVGIALLAVGKIRNRQGLVIAGVATAGLAVLAILTFILTILPMTGMP